MASQATQQERGGHDGRTLCRSIDVELRVLDEAERTIEVIASSEALDSHGDVLKQFWDLSRYEKNPVVLWNHNKFGTSSWSEGTVRPEDLFPIGQSVSIAVKAKKLVATIKLGTKEYSEIAEKVFLGCKEKIIRAVSVGFRPGNINAIKDKAGNTVRYELGSPEFPNELREISFVPMGSNPDAVAKSIEADRALLRAMFEEQESTMARSADQESTSMLTAEEKTAHEKALNDARAASDRAEKAESDLKAEKAASGKLETELKAARDENATLKSERITSEIEKRVGTKLTPAEKDEHVQLAKDIGIERALKMIDARPSLTLTNDVTVDGKAVSDEQTPPAPTSGDASADLVKDIEKKTAA